VKDLNDRRTRDLISVAENRKGRGGWRDGGRPKANYQTKMFRADVRLSGIIETLKARLKSGTIDESELKTFEELVTN
jgi:hypothetical protein